MGKDNYILTYYQQILDGSVTVGKWIRLVYEYIVDGIEAKRFRFDQKQANKAIEWIEEHAFHVEGPLAPSNMKLELWQKAFLSCVFGILDEDGDRQFQEVLLVVGRKNGKSLLATAMAKYIWWEAGGYGAKVFCLAPKFDQADIIYNSVWQMTKLDPDYIDLDEKIKASREGHSKGMETDDLPKKRVSDLYIASNNSSVKKIAFNAKTSDGFNPSLAICDEIAAWEGDRGLKQYEVMTSGMGSRPDSFTLSCTTSGYVNDGIYDELIKRGTRFLLGDSEEKGLLPFLYMIDDVGKWNDINELRKSNPNLGVSLKTKKLIKEIAVAEGSLSKKTEFITKYCNIKQNSSLAWLESTDIEAATGEPLRLEDFRGHYCVAGFDLSRTTDLTATTIVIEKNGELYVFAKFFLPEERIEDATAADGVPYNIYIQRGLLQPSGGNIVDYHDVFNWYRELVEEYEIYPLKVGYDSYSAAYLVQEMEGYGFHMDNVFQGYNLHPVIVETEGYLKDKKIHIGDNDLLKIHFFNSALKVSAEKGRSKLIKIKPTAHIDGMAALLDAMTVRQKWYGDIGHQLKNEEIQE